MKKLLFLSFCVMLLCGCDAVDNAVMSAVSSEMEKSDTPQNTAETPTEPYSYDTSEIRNKLAENNEKLLQQMQENNQKFQQGQVSAEDIKNDPEKVKEQVIPDYAAQKAQAEKEKQMIEQVQNYQK